MAEPSPAGQHGPRRGGRPLGSYLASRLVVPSVCLVLAWGALAGAVFAGALRGVLGRPGHHAVDDAVLLAGAGLLVALIVIVLVWLFVRRVTREAALLAETARVLADERLPVAVARIRQGILAPGTGPQPAAPGGTGPYGTGPHGTGPYGAGRREERQLPPRARIAEFAAVGDVLGRLEETTLGAALAEARLRSGFRQVLTSLGRRNQSLLLRQLRIIDTLEQQAASPAALADLFTLDHVTTRMRRHAESLTILSGAPTARPRTGPVPVIDVIRAAVAETEDYKRVVARTTAEETVAASAVNDLIHLLAELIENALLFSPSATKVEVRAERVANGFVIEVEDRGLGIAAEQLGDLNQRLASPPDFDLVDADRLGLFVAGLLAARHRVEVSLSPSPYRGTKAIVLLPDGLTLPPPVELPPSPAAGRLRRPANSLSLVGVSGSGALPEPGRGGLETAAPPEPAGPTTFHGLPRRVRPGRQQEAPVPGSQPEAAPAARQPEAAAPAQPEAAQERPASLGRRPVSAGSPAPEDARRLAASLQRSWQRSRAEDEAEREVSGRTGTAAGPWGRDSEEEP